ncbi:hypothetical protein HPB47_014862 [Ixodes persulcatus]|uniref:Uncharacterized protein n=1 Tax=Ixodes persulcatus TaxID=34615 RepID=A0AC60QV16_IXOPE|nr:hypothetical protein HPB47_014862 [Ixodes persulcatus]
MAACNRLATSDVPTSMSLAVPPPFLPVPGGNSGGGCSKITCWLRGVTPMDLLGGRVFYTLPETHPPVPLKETTAGSKTPTAPDEYDAALAALETYFAETSNVVVA